MSQPRLTAELIAALRGVLAGADAPVALHEPCFAGNEWHYLKDCLDSGWVSSVGAYVDRFEAELAALTGAGHAVAAVNGTAALHLCLLLAGVRPGDEVIVPSLTFVGTANAVAHCGAVPHFADSEARSLGLDAAELAKHLAATVERRDDGLFNRDTGRRIAAVLATHIFGFPCDLDALAAMSESWGLPLIEDAAEGLGSTYKGRHVGTHGLLAALSFNGNKILTTGGGGAVLTDDPDLAERAKYLSTTAKRAHPWRYDHTEVGYNYRLPNLNAALGCAQLEQLPGFLRAKRRLAESYAAALDPVAGLRFCHDPPETRSNCWLNAVALDRGDPALLDSVLSALHAEGILARPAWTLMHRLPMYADLPRGDLSVCEDLANRLICLPSSAALGEAA